MGLMAFAVAKNIHWDGPSAVDGMAKWMGSRRKGKEGRGNSLKK
jgi:hypothetical protein